MPRETCIDKIKGENWIEVTTDDPKYLKLLKNYAKKYPQAVTIRPISDDTYISAQVDANWFQFIKPPTKRILTEEQKQAAAERLKKARERGCK